MESRIFGRVDRISWNKMSASLYFTDGSSIPLNSLMGMDIEIYVGESLACTSCESHDTESSVCGDCFGEAPLADCVMNPGESCTYQDCPFPDFKSRSCSHNFIVYLGTKRGRSCKVGISSYHRTSRRWREQGLSYACRIANTPNRKVAGVIEHLLSENGFAGRLPHDWYVEREEAKEVVSKGVDDAESRIPSQYEWVLADDIEMDIVEIQYPNQEEYPEGASAVPSALGKGRVATGRLQGIRGQQLLLDTCTVNLKRASGHNIEIRL